MKLITKILDKYYSDKLCKEVKTYMLLQWFIDVRFVERKYTIELQVKKPKELQVKKPKYDEKQSDSVVINDEALTGDDREDSSLKVNAIVVMYDIVEKTDDIRGVVKYKNIPLGIYFTGCLEDGLY